MLMIWNDDEIELRNAQNRNEPINYTRKLPWEKGTIECIDQSGNSYILHSLSADFYYVSTRKKHVACGKYRIIRNEKNEILWIGRYEDGHFFIMSNDQVYALWYERGTLCLKQTICKISENTRKIDGIYLDELINKNKTDIDRAYTYTRLSFHEFMEKEFYLRGPKWQDGKYPNDITVLNRIINCNNGLLKIELENITYPFDAWVVFDISKLKIIDGKANIPTKIDKTSNSINDDEIYEKIKNILVDIFEIDEGMIKMDTNIDDYSYGKMDYTGIVRGMEYLGLVFQLEECFNIKIVDDDFTNIKTVKDLYEYIEKKAV
jgi:acyl carrier protein